MSRPGSGRRLILHIGMPKTGTSTLQQALCSHPELLGRFGVLYPHPMFDQSNHNMVATLFHDEQSMPREFSRGGSVPLETIRDDGRAFWADVSQQIRRSDAETVVLSGEYFFFMRDEWMVELQVLLADLFDDIHVVAYVRHPADHYLAFMQQTVKASFVIQSPAEVRMSSRVNLGRYLDAFDGSVSVRPFEREALDGGSVVTDFVGRFLPGGVELAKGIEVVDLNESMSAEAMCILQSFRRHGWPEENNRFAVQSTDAIAALRAAGDRIAQTRAELRPAIRAALNRKYQKDIDWLASTFDVAFAPDASRADPADAEPEGWRSHELRDILEVDPAQVDHVLYLLLKELMTERRAWDARLEAKAQVQVRRAAGILPWRAGSR